MRWQAVYTGDIELSPLAKRGRLDKLIYLAGRRRRGRNKKRERLVNR